MENFDSLYKILAENLELYEDFVKIEYEKYESIANDDIKRLDEIIEKEQVHYLKAKGLEQKRMKITDGMNMKDKTLKEIIHACEDDCKSDLRSIYEKLFKTLEEFKKINGECKTLLEVKLHRIEKVQNKPGEKEGSLKSQMISRKI